MGRPDLLIFETRRNPMVSKTVLSCLLILCLAGTIQGQVEYTAKDTMWILVETHLNWQLTDWDSAYTLLSRNGVTVGDTVFLISIEPGRYRGSIAFDSMSIQPGVYLREDYASYSGDTSGQSREIEFRDTLDYTMLARIGTATDPKDMATTLFAGQQYLADDCCGVGGGGGCGAGAFACTISVRDTIAEAGINLVHVFLRNSNQAPLLNGWTNADGLVTFYTDSLGTGLQHKIWLDKPGFAFDNPDSLDLRTDTTFTFYMVDDSVQCYVFSSVYHPTLTTFAGVEVSARIYVPGDSIIYYEGRIISPFTVKDTTNSNGEWTLPLIPNEFLVPGATGYIFNLRYPASWGPFFTGVDADTFTVPALKSCQYDSLGSYP
jgi:hypothetical protein